MDFALGKVKSIRDLGKVKEVVAEIQGEEKVYEAKAVILAAGAKNRELGLPDEKKLTGAGVSYCATCDGMFFRDRNVAVAGGGNTALEDALFLSNYCKEVALIHRRDTFRGEQKMVEELQKKDNVTFFCNKKVIGLQSKGVLQGICLEDTKTGEKQELPVEGLFVAIGQEPENDRFIPLVDLDPKGYILAGEDCKTKTPGIFAAGDCRAKKVRQLGNGCFRWSSSGPGSMRLYWDINFNKQNWEVKRK